MDQSVRLQDKSSGLRHKQIALDVGKLDHLCPANGKLLFREASDGTDFHVDSFEPVRPSAFHCSGRSVAA
jgi:hypothetical protein